MKLFEDEGANSSSLAISASWDFKFSFLHCSCYTADSCHRVSIEAIRLNWFHQAEEQQINSNKVRNVVVHS